MQTFKELEEAVVAYFRDNPTYGCVFWKEEKATTLGDAYGPFIGVNGCLTQEERQAIKADARRLYPELWARITGCDLDGKRIDTPASDPLGCLLLTRHPELVEEGAQRQREHVFALYPERELAS